jgi:anti-anti-sigma factor
MRIEEQAYEDGVVWLLHGGLTGEDGVQLRGALSRAALVGRATIVIDMSDVAMIDAGGLGSLVTVHRASAAKLIALSLTGVPTRVRQLLAITHLTMFLTIFDSVEEACTCGKRGALIRTRGPGRVTKAPAVAHS